MQHTIRKIHCPAKNEKTSKKEVQNDTTIKKLDEAYKYLFAFWQTGEVSQLQKNDYKVSVSIEIGLSPIFAILCVLDTGKSPKHPGAEFLDHSRRYMIRHQNMTEIRSDSDAKLGVSKTVPVPLFMG